MSELDIERLYCVAANADPEHDVKRPWEQYDTFVLRDHQTVAAARSEVAEFIATFDPPTVLALLGEITRRRLAALKIAEQGEKR